MFRRRSVLGLAVFCGLACGGVLPAAAAPPRVVASIKPLQSLLDGVMAGVATPAVIVDGAASPHTFSLRPSSAALLDSADVIVWIGPIFESFLIRPVRSLDHRVEIVELDREPTIKLLPARAGGPWDKDDDAPPVTAAAFSMDGHLFLDPENAKAIVRLMVGKLGVLDPPDAARYAANGAAVERRLDRLDAALKVQLAPLHHAPFIVFHDGYQYLERRYGLDAIGSITVDPEIPPGARRLAEMRDKVVKLGAVCVFREPEFEPTLVHTLIEGTKARAGVLDPVAGALPNGPNLYFDMMHGLANALSTCLTGPR